MATLKSEHKVFIVRRLAAFDTPHQCAAAVKEEFNLVVSPQQVQTYHPEKHAGRNLSKTFKDLFYEMRKKFRENTDDIPIANKSHRVKVLDRMADAAEKKGNMVLAAQLMEQAAKEMGEAYTNKSKLEHTGKDGAPLTMPTHIQLVPYSGPIKDGE